MTKSAGEKDFENKHNTILYISNFSSIKEASIILSKCNIIIGPQSSGKSLIAKLIYFFHQVVFEDFFRSEDIFNIVEYKEHIQNEFIKRFPVSAWGSSKFIITFEIGHISVSIKRRVYRGPTDKTSISLSSKLLDDFDRFRAELSKAQAEITESTVDTSIWFKKIEVEGGVRKRFADDWKTIIGSKFVNSQLFIPAGRSFFTSLGKAISAFERGGMLDPLIIEFGRYYLDAKSRFYGRHYFFPEPKENVEMKNAIENLFDGKLLFKKEEEYLEAVDGRVIPVSFLSSGQQELIPLWVGIEHEFMFDTSNKIIYIEEPEAHLFPQTQSILVEHMTQFILNTGKKTRLFLTTHSPYILSKFNNLIKAGALSKKRGKIRRVDEVVRRELWINKGEVSAYYLDSGNAIAIIDDDGMIDAEFLDEVSADISEEFGKLLDIEYGVES